MKFNPNVSVALGLDDDWTLRSFEIQESSLSTWTNHGVDGDSRSLSLIGMLMNVYFHCNIFIKKDKLVPLLKIHLLGPFCMKLLNPSKTCFKSS